MPLIRQATDRRMPAPKAAQAPPLAEREPSASAAVVFDVGEALVVVLRSTLQRAAFFCGLPLDAAGADAPSTQSGMALTKNGFGGCGTLAPRCRLGSSVPTVAPKRTPYICRFSMTRCT